MSALKKIVKTLIGQQLFKHFPSSSQALGTVVEPCDFIKCQNQYIQLCVNVLEFNLSYGLPYKNLHINKYKLTNTQFQVQKRNFRKINYANC